MDGAIRNQLLALLGNALAGGGGDAGVFPMSAGNWLQLVTAAATGNSQQLFSTLAGNAIRNQLLGLLGGALGGDGAGANGGVFAQSGPGSSIFPSTDAVPLDIWGSLSDGLGRGDAPASPTSSPPRRAAGATGATAPSSRRAATAPPSPRLAELRLDPEPPQWPPPTTRVTVFANGSRRCSPPTKRPPRVPTLRRVPPRAERRGRPTAPRVARPRLEPPRSPAATRDRPRRRRLPDAAPGLLLGRRRRVAARAARKRPRASPFDATRPAGGDGWFVSDWTLLGRPRRWPMKLKRGGA